MTKEEVIKKIGEERWDEFCKWMFGQTVGMTEKGEIDYYEWDVERFMGGLNPLD